MPGADALGCADWVGPGVAPSGRAGPGGDPLRLAALRKPGTRRGTGCTLASAIAARLARGDDLATACAEAKHYLNGWW